jgi:hypothetical protein
MHGQAGQPAQSEVPQMPRVSLLARAPMVAALEFLLLTCTLTLTCGCKDEAPAKTTPVAAVPTAATPKPPKKNAPPPEPETMEVSFTAELDPMQVKEAIEVGFYAKGGPVQPQSRLAVASFVLTRAEPKQTVKVELKRQFDYQVKIDARTRLECNGAAVTGVGAYTGPSAFNPSRQAFRVRGDASESQVHVDPVAGYALRYEAPLEIVTDKTTGTGKNFSQLSAQVAKVGIAKVVLTTGTPIVQGAEVWVTSDGARLVPWPVGTSRVEFLVASGGHTISVLSNIKGQPREVFRKAINAAPGTTQTWLAGN